ncbi:hypothetical protein RCL06_24190, partial [Salmonella enterica subsp. enterica serovar Typhimurium]
SFIINLYLATGGIALACSSFQQRASALATVGNFAALRAEGFGELIPTATRNTGETFLALPKGFEYNVFGREKALMADGRPTPARHDGMWTF